MDEAAPTERWALGQAAAFEMLDRHLLAGRPSAEKAEAVAFYLPMIVEARSPEAEVVADALTAYAPYLNGGEVRSLAARAAEVGRGYVARECSGDGDCVPDDPRLGERADLLAQRDIRNAQISDAVVELDAIARRR